MSGKISIRFYKDHLKAKLRREQSGLVSATAQLKLTASDGKKYNTYVMRQSEIIFRQ